MAKEKLTYSQIKKIADMSVEEYRDSEFYSEQSFTNWFGENLSDDEIQDIIDRMSDAVNNNNDYADKWKDAVAQAESAYDEMYDDSLKYLENTSGVTDEQWDEAYNASVSDNYATGNVDGIDLSNITIDDAIGDDKVEIDWSEMQTMKKTQLSNGEFVRYSPSDSFDDDSEIGESRNICGGTITYLGRESVSYDRGEFGEGISAYAGTQGVNAGPLGDGRAHMVHYKGVLGEFDYNADEFSLGYWEAEVNGKTVYVPTLHYINDGAVKNGFNWTYDGFVDGEKIKIPEGLESMDYMFAGTGIRTMPKIPSSVKSAHCAFMNCTELERGSNSSKVQSGPDAGKLQMPESLEDASWMFAGCTQMQDYFGNFSKNLIDGRYMNAECKSLGWDGKSLDENGDMVTSFEMPDVSRIRNANAFWLTNMYDNCSDEVIAKLEEYKNAHNGELTSEWTAEDGSHYGNYDHLIDGSYDPGTAQDVDLETSRGQILQMIDKKGQGLTGVASDTGNLASSGVQITDNGTFADDSVWAKFRQSDFEATYGTDNQFGEILNHAIPAVGTYAVSKSILNSMTGGKHKALSTIGAVAVAAVPQIVGYGDTLTPVLDWTANAVGPETKVGKFLTEFSQKLKGEVTYHTRVSELNTDETFESVQDSAVKYAENQIARFTTAVAEYDGEKDVTVATRFDVSADMAKNGEYLGKDANLLFIACEPEENLKSTLSDSIMKTSIESIRDKMDLELKNAGDDEESIKAIREKYSGYYMTMLYNLDAYDNAAKATLESTYATDPELKDQAMNGLEKVMRTTAKPLYDSMTELNKMWEDEYGEAFFTDKQMNESEKSTSSMSITGLGTFNDYDPTKDYSDQSDVYVEKLATYQQALVKALEDAHTDEKIDAAYASYYETAYGWALDEAEAHGVILDKRGAQTTAEKDSFAQYVQQVEAEQKATIDAGDGTGAEIDKTSMSSDEQENKVSAQDAVKAFKDASTPSETEASDTKTSSEEEMSARDKAAIASLGLDGVPDTDEIMSEMDCETI